MSSPAVPLHRFACPSCKSALRARTPEAIECTACGRSFPVRDGVPLLLPAEVIAAFAVAPDAGIASAGASHASPRTSAEWERLHRQEAEPWSYSSRAAEILRHRFLVAQCLRRTVATPRRIADIGCSLGTVAAALAQRGATVTALDLSPSAVARAHARYRLEPWSPAFAAGMATALPLPSGAFDLVVAADGLYSWRLDPGQCRAAIREVTDALAPGGVALFSDYMQPRRFASFVGLVRESALSIERVERLHDRVYYALELASRPFHDRRWCRRMLASVPLAKALSVVARAFGSAGSSHLCVVASKRRVEA